MTTKDDVRNAPHAVLEIGVMVQPVGQDFPATQIVLLPLDKAEARMLSGQVEALRGIMPFSALTCGDDMVVALRVRVKGVRLVSEDDLVPGDAPAPVFGHPRSSGEPADSDVSSDREMLIDSLADWMGGE